ncbi:hypothetical protein FFLO_00338 [Filobasidium floriforme]|uniref:triacylglycerol lipase n=1 Tax=Filobasidium floriforme TaxID=5210 RepID=A0A8K0JSE5_9TREE|nr:secretory lipase-domain-containing protein [Filobasidium floriforme]KAG7575348.1 hypothetical protein FFLO_00338 [Filobasidium floriforme]KAH8089563.1 secretory lipase-domain-containing protein [Filobasidium floriforme]
MKLFIFLSSLLAIATAAPLVDRALPPSLDPFYDPPSGWESQPVGSILKTRSVVTATASIVANLAIDGTQLLYRTAGPAGEALSTVVTILRPAGAKKDRLLAYTFAEDSNARKCAPSYNLQFASVPTNLITTVENFLVQAALAQGWTVTVPDYQGPNSAFIAGQLEGRAVLDGIRATLKYPNLNLNNPKIAVWGYSGGAAAAGWTGALQPSYAPELNMIGVAQGGTPAYLPGTARFIDGTALAGLAFGALAGMGSAYPAFETRIQELLTSQGKQEIVRVRERCATDNIFAYAGQKILETYVTTGTAALDDPIIKPILDQQTMGAPSTPRVPVYVYHAANDDVVPYADVPGMVDSWCNDGATVEFVTDVAPSTNHFAMEILHFPAVLDWLKGRFDGTINPSGCSRKEISQSLLGSTTLAESVGGNSAAAAVNAANAALQASPLA